VMFGCLALYLTFRIARRLIHDPVLQCVPSFLVACSIPFFCWNQRGLESALHLCVVLFLCEVCCDERYRRYWYWPAILLCISRPEGFVLLVALLPFFLLYWRQIPGLGRGVAILAVILTLLTLLRLWYFHDPLPHPFYIKGNTDPSGGAPRLLAYVRDNGLAFLLVPSAIAWCLYRRPVSQQGVLAASFLVVTLLWSTIGIEGLTPYFRHLGPALPFLFMIAIAGLDRVARGRASAWAVRGACIAFALAMLAFSRSNYTPMRASPSVFMHAASVAMQDPLAYAGRVMQILRNPDEFFSDVYPRSPLQTYNAQLLRDPINTNFQATAGKFIRMNYPEGITFVYDQMGQTPWYAGADKRVIDSYGLLSKRIGYFVFERKLGGGPRPLFRIFDALMFRLSERLWPDELRRVRADQALDYIFAEDPELIIINDYEVPMTWHIPSRLSRDPRLLEGYRPAYLVNKRVRIYERNDIYSAERRAIPRVANVARIGRASGEAPRYR